MKAKILLVRPPFYSVFGTEEKIGNIPLGVCYIASTLEEAGYQVSILDCEVFDYGEKTDTGKMRLAHQMSLRYSRYAEVMNDENHPIWNKIVSEIVSRDPDIIGFTTHTAAMTSVIYISRLLKKKMGVPIILGGTHPTVMPELSLHESKADVAVIGEGEKTIIELVPALLEQSPLHTIKGIAYVKDSIFSLNEQRERIQDLDQIPFPARHLMDRSSYRAEAFGYVTSSRGCPFNCLFCTSRLIWGRQVVFRSVTNVLDEVEKVQATYGTKQFRFADDTFTLDRNRVLDFCKEIKERELDISFRSTSRTDTVDAEVLSALKTAGCNRISFGVESGSQRILDLIGKKSTLKKARNAVKAAQKAGLFTIATFIVGNPTETLEELRATVKLIDEIHPSRSIINLMTVYPGTALYEEDQSREWWKYYFQGESVRSVSALSEEKLNEVYNEISSWVMKKNMGENATPPRLDS